MERLDEVQTPLGGSADFINFFYLEKDKQHDLFLLCGRSYFTSCVGMQEEDDDDEWMMWRVE